MYAIPLYSESVKYACTCGNLRTIEQLLFCQYCSQLRCSFCVAYKVESISCGKCCENIPTQDAKLKKNKCSRCLTCPSCCHDLSIRATTKTSSEIGNVHSLSYYLTCLNCRWSTRDIGLPNQDTFTLPWPKRTFVHANRVQEIIHMHVDIQEKEKLDKKFFEKKRELRMVSYTDITGVTAASLRKRLGMPVDKPIMRPKKMMRTAVPSVAQENIDDFDEDILTKPLNIMEVTTVEQRLLQPDTQPAEMSQIYPVAKMLSMKRSSLCRTCDSVICKPEYLASSTRFKVSLFALYHVPEIRIVTVAPLIAGKPCDLILKFHNPTEFLMSIKLLSYDEIIDPIELYLHEKSLDPKKKIIPSGVKYMAMMKEVAIKSGRIVPPRPIEAGINCSIQFLSAQFLLSARDDSARYENSTASRNVRDGKKLKVWKQNNHSFVTFTVTPNKDLPVGTAIIVGFTVSHFHSTVARPIEKENVQTSKNKFKVLLNIGNSVG